MRKLALLLAAVVPSVAQAQPARPPKLVVAISVDQLSSDLFDDYRPRLSGGLARLATGTVYRNGYQAHECDRDVPRPFDDPDRARCRAAAGSSPTTGSTCRRRGRTRASIAPRTSACRDRRRANIPFRRST